MSANTARSAAEKLISRMGIHAAPVDVGQIARDLRLPVVFAELGEGISGLLVTSGGASYVCVQQIDSHVRQRFTIAHEIGHFVMRHHHHFGDHVHVDRGNFISQRGPRSSIGLDMKEIEANQFAASLLMPAKMVHSAARHLAKTGPLLDSHVGELATQFDVSEQAITIRLSALGLL